MTKRLGIFALWLVISWTLMCVVHEAGHIVGGYIVGATLIDYDLAPWRLPYSLHQPDPNPLVTLWMGPVLGVLVPLAVSMIFRAAPVRFVADFCLLANGCYLACAWWMGDRLLDTPRLLDAGAGPFTIAAFCAITIPLGYVRFRADCIELLQPSPPQDTVQNESPSGT